MLIVTTFSLVVAAISGVLAWRVLREDRLRSAARVSALEAAIENDGGFDGDFEWENPPDPPDPPDPVPATPFSAVTRASRPSIPLLGAAAALIVGVIVVVLMAMLADRDNRPASAAEAPTRESRAAV